MEIPLTQLGRGKTAVIKSLKGGCEFQRKIASLNIRVGKTIKKITAQPLRGPIVIEVGNTKVSLGMGMAMKIFVEEKK